MYTPHQPPQQPPQQQQQFQAASKQRPIVIDDDEVMVDEEKTSKNVCIGMIITDIVVEKPPLVLPKDDQYEIISLESEGKLNTENYCKLPLLQRHYQQDTNTTIAFKVTSRSIPAKFVSAISKQKEHTINTKSHLVRLGAF